MPAFYVLEVAVICPSPFLIQSDTLFKIILFSVPGKSLLEEKADKRMRAAKASGKNRVEPPLSKDSPIGLSLFRSMSRKAEALVAKHVSSRPQVNLNRYGGRMLGKNQSVCACKFAGGSKIKHISFKTFLAASVTSALAFVSPQILAQGLKGAKVASVAGNWTVYRSLGPISDKITCTGLLKGDVKAQLVANSLYVPVSGGIQSVTLRFGENAANAMRLPQKMEKDVRALIIEGADFQSAVESMRLRGQVLTLVSGVFTFDLDMAGISEALENIRGDCPIQPEPVAKKTPPETTAAVSPAAQTSPPSQPAATCSDKVLARMTAESPRVLRRQFCLSQAFSV